MSNSMIRLIPVVPEGRGPQTRIKQRKEAELVRRKGKSDGPTPRGEVKTVRKSLVQIPAWGAHREYMIAKSYETTYKLAMLDLEPYDDYEIDKALKDKVRNVRSRMRSYAQGTRNSFSGGLSTGRAGFRVKMPRRVKGRTAFNAGTVAGRGAYLAAKHRKGLAIGAGAAGALGAGGAAVYHYRKNRKNKGS